MPSLLRAAHPSRSVDKTRVLVVEDESDIAGLIKHTLERSGDALVEIAASGDQALNAATDRRDDARHPDQAQVRVDPHLDELRGKRAGGPHAQVHG